VQILYSVSIIALLNDIVWNSSVIWVKFAPSLELWSAQGLVFPKNSRSRYLTDFWCGHWIDPSLIEHNCACLIWLSSVRLLSQELPYRERKERIFSNA